MSIVQLVTRTIPFFVSRIVVYGIFALASLIFLGLMLGLSILLFNWFEFASGFFILLIISTFFIVLGALRFVERYVLYMVKVGHVSVVTELLRTGKIPDGKNQLSYGKDQVINNFGSANVCFVVDKIIHAAVKQIQRWLMRIGNFFNFVPGAKRVIGIISKILEMSLRYVDESILSYIMLRKSEGKDESVWKSACDGVVLYAQSWKKIIMTATGIVAFVLILNFVIFLMAVFPLMAVSSWVASSQGAAAMLGYIAVVGAYVIVTMIKRAIIDPIAMIAMVRAFQLNIKGMEPSIDLQQKLLNVSSKFKELFNKSKNPPQETVSTPQTVDEGVSPSV